MTPRARWLEGLAVVLFLGTAFFPLHVARQHPQRMAQGVDAGTHGTTRPPPSVAVPAQDLCDAALLDLSSCGPGWRLWEVRRWYPYALAPLWLVALLLSQGRAAARRRHRVGLGLLVLAGALVVLEACYLGTEYAPLLPDPWGRGEVVAAWLLVVTILFWRRRADRRVDAVEAHVGAQALLGLVHLLTLPSSEARGWIGAYPLGDVLGALAANFRPAFWLACLGLALAATATYLTRRPLPAPEPVRPA